MAISIDWPTKVIFVPKAYTSLVTLGPPEVRSLDINAFRLDLKAIEASSEGMGFSKTNDHNTEVILSGVTYARIVEIVNGYTITFEDGAYSVQLVGANSNIVDVTNFNTVRPLAANSAGLVNNSPDLAEAVWAYERV